MWHYNTTDADSLACSIVERASEKPFRTWDTAKCVLRFFVALLPHRQKEYHYEKGERKQLKDLYEQAMAAKDLHHMDEAIALLTQAADGGYQQAMLTLGVIYHWGLEVDPDDDKAIYWLKKDADLAE